MKRSPRTLRSCMAVILACLLLPPAEAWSQDSAGQLPVTLGSRVRILAPSVVDGRLEGFLTGIEDEFLLVGVQESAPLRVRRDAIMELDVSTGKERRVRKGILIGALGGALWGAGIGALIKRDRWGKVPIESVALRAAPVRGKGAQIALAVTF